jgi:hypothetical protein
MTSWKAAPMTSDIRLNAMAEIIGLAIFQHGLLVLERTDNVLVMVDTEHQQYTVTVRKRYVPTPDDKPSITEVWQRCLNRDDFATAASHDADCAAHDTLGVDGEGSKDEDAPDDDGDDDEQPTDPAIFDGGFGHGSYFDESMRKDD